MTSRLFNLWAFCLLSIYAYAHPPSAPIKEPSIKKSLFDVLQNQEIQQVSLEMDMEALLNNRKTNEEIPAQFSFSGNNGLPQVLNVKVRSRGRFRRRICEMPPLKLNFKKGELKEVGLQKFDSYKLVTHCINDEDARDNILKEFLAYQMYEKMTRYSFRTQLVEITYRDSKTGEEQQQLGFFIEDTDELAKRLNATRIKERYGSSLADLETNNAMLQTMFQYMIGNVDWEVVSLRNLKMMQPMNSEVPVIIPYDFDFSGFVNPSYAKARRDLGQQTPTQRVFLGKGLEKESWEKIVRYYKAKKPEILKTIDNCSLLSRAGKKEAKAYLMDFFNQLDYSHLFIES